MCHQVHRDLGPKLAVGVPSTGQSLGWWGSIEASAVCVCKDTHGQALPGAQSPRHTCKHTYMYVSSDTERPDTSQYRHRETHTQFRHTCRHDGVYCKHTYTPPAQNTDTAHQADLSRCVQAYTDTHPDMQTLRVRHGATDTARRTWARACTWTCVSKHRAPHKLMGRLTAHRPIPALLWIPGLVTAA